MSDERVAAVANLDRSDAPTAALAVALAPAVLLTDNRKHFLPFGMPSIRSDVVAKGVMTVSEFAVGVRGAALLPVLGGVSVLEGSRSVIERVGKNRAALIGLLLLVGGALFLRSARGRSARARAGLFVREAAPLASAMIAAAVVAGQRLERFAVQPAKQTEALGLIARRLAVIQPEMTTREVAKELRESGFRFDDDSSLDASTRAWLVEQSCFHELSPGHWSLGSHAAALPLGRAD